MNVPPPLVSFESLEKYLFALDNVVSEQQIAEIRGLHESSLPIIVSIRALAVLFGFHPQFLGAIAETPDRYYRSFVIPKGRSKRRIHAPKVALKVIQKWFGHHICRNTSTSEHVFGFVPGKSTFDGALIHCRSEWMYSADIENFFPSIKRDKIANSLSFLGYSSHGAQKICDFTCLNNGLAQGSPASPPLSNIVFKQTDSEIEEYCQANTLRYSRYADDIVISGVDSPPKDLQQFLLRTISQQGWSISNKKSGFTFAPSRMKVFGLVVNGEKPRLTKGYRKRIRAIKHQIKHGRLDAENAAAAYGHLAYAESVERRSEQ